MRKFVWGLVGCSLALGTAIGAQAPAKPAAARPAAAAPRLAFRPAATVKDIMDSIVIPASEAVFGAVSSEAGPNGDVEKVPKNDAEWQAVRRQAMMLIEGGNLLMIEGRHVAPASAKSEHPGVELEPAQMDALVAKNKAAFTKAASGLIDTALVALKAIDAKNPMALSDAGGDIDEACENCHTQFWYPDEKKQ
jgi:hypothetical protein